MLMNLYTVVSVTIVTEADKRIRHSRRLKSSLAISQAWLENKSDH